MDDHFLDGGAALAEILSGVEDLGLFRKYAADRGGHGKTDIGVDVDLADSHLSSLAQLCFGNADSVGQLTAESVDLADEFLRDGRSTVQHDGEAGQSLFDLLEDVEAKRRRNEQTVGIAGARG